MEHTRSNNLYWISCICANLKMWGSLNISWHTLAGIMFTSAQVSSLALRYIFLWWWGCNLYARLVIRCVAFGTLLSLACLCLTFSCKQNDSSEVLSSSEWSYEALLCTCVPPACNWCALGFLCLKGACFFWKHILVKWPNLWQTLHWYFFAGHWNASTCTESPHLEHLVLSLCTPLGSNCFLGCTCKWYPSWPWFLLFDCLGFILEIEQSIHEITDTKDY